MGLDQYAKKVTASYSDDGLTQTIVMTEIAYWRKHNFLQGWMEKRWRDSGGEGQFNCVVVDLILEDLDALEKDVLASNLPETCASSVGPVWWLRAWGDSRYKEYWRDRDLMFIEEGRKALKEGCRLEYSSCW